VITVVAQYRTAPGVARRTGIRVKTLNSCASGSGIDRPKTYRCRSGIYRFENGGS
jgi:hypothetical protein